jgi:hypothetical protein
LPFAAASSTYILPLVKVKSLAVPMHIALYSNVTGVPGEKPLLGVYFGTSEKAQA